MSKYPLLKLWIITQRENYVRVSGYVWDDDTLSHVLKFVTASFVVTGDRGRIYACDEDRNIVAELIVA